VLIRILREQHEPPEAVRRRLEIAGGRNRFGEANYRAVWGWSRLAWVGGKWEDRNAAGDLVRECIELRRVPKYEPHDRWHIERWLPPEAYGSPRAWWYASAILSAVSTASEPEFVKNTCARSPGKIAVSREASSNARGWPIWKPGA